MNELETKTDQLDTELCWYYTPDNKQRLGPFTLDKVCELVAADQEKLTQRSLVWRSGSAPFPAANLMSVEATDEFEKELDGPDEEADKSGDGETPEQGHVSSPLFYSDLKKVYERLHIDSQINLPKLAERFENRKAVIRERMGLFHRDLVNVTERALLDPNRNLKRLEERLCAWRAWAAAELRRHMDDVPDDDPLRCSISLFGTLDQGRMERAHTNTLAWLLDPREVHKFGSLLVDRLFERLEGSESSIHVNFVKAEQDADGERLDVFVDGRMVDETGTHKWCMMIEAKVGAKESEDQLAEYDQWIKKKEYKKITRIFLTPDGRTAESSEEEEWKPLSFLELAAIFRTGLLSLEKTAEGYHFLRYYLTGILKDVCRWQLPIDPQKAPDPYGFLKYVKQVSGNAQEGVL